AKRNRLSSRMGAAVHIDLPKSSRTIPVIQARNCLQSGWSRPSRTRSLSRFSFEANELSPANRSSTMSPGTTRIRKKMITATPNSVGIIRSKRLMMYLVTARRPLLGQPHAVELVVDEMAGRDGPAAELGAVRDDAVPLERVGVVRLLVQQSPLEVADVFPPLLGVEGAALLLVEIVQGLVDVAAVVVAADPHRLELVQVQVGVDRVAALGVDGDLVVAVAQIGLPLRRLDEVVARLQTDLTPLVHEPDGHRLVGHGDVPVLQAEREVP